MLQKPFKDSTEKYCAMQSAYWLDGSLRYADVDALRSVSEPLLEAIYDASGLQRKRKQLHLPQLETLLLALLRASSTPFETVAIPLGRDEYSRIPDISFRVLVKFLIPYFEQVNFLEKHLGYFGGMTGRITRYRLLNPMRDWLKQAGLTPHLIFMQRPKTLLQIKPPKGEKVLPIERFLSEREVTKVQEIKKDMAVYNDHLQKAFIDLCVSENEELEINKKMASKAMVSEDDLPSGLWLEKKYSKRVFNNHSLRLGGRFYGSWWQTLPRKWRNRIVIDEDTTTEIDFSQMHFRLLYAKEDKDIASSPDDLYSIEGMDASYRDYNKLLLLAALNAGSRGSLINMLAKKVRKDKDPWYPNGYPPGFNTPSSLIDYLLSQHPKLKKYFYSGIGLRLQNIDSEIMHNVINRMLIEHGAICLSVHDSVITKEKYYLLAERILIEEYEKKVGVKPVLKQKPLMSTDKKIFVTNNSNYQLRRKAFEMQK